MTEEVDNAPRDFVLCVLAALALGLIVFAGSRLDAARRDMCAFRANEEVRFKDGTRAVTTRDGKYSPRLEFCSVRVVIPSTGREVYVPEPTLERTNDR